MPVKITCVFVLALAVTCIALENTEDATIKLVLKVYDDCSNSEGFSPCLKKKALTLLDRLGRMDNFNFIEGVTIVRDGEASPVQENPISEEQLEQTLPRSADAKDEALNNMLLEKVSSLIGSRKLQVTMPKFSTEDFEFEGRKKKNKGMGGQLIALAAAKIVSLKAAAIAALFLLAKKALIIAKVALLISVVIAVKKFFGHHHDGGHGGGYQSGGGYSGGWSRRSQEEAQKMAYKAYT